MFFHKKEKRKMSDMEKEGIIGTSYRNIVQIANDWIHPSSHEVIWSEQILLLDYLIDSLLDDICTTIVVVPLTKGKITSEEYDLPLLYPNLKTDGTDWFNAHTDEKITPVSDFRFAAVFTLAKMRYEMIQSEETTKNGKLDSN